MRRATALGIAILVTAVLAQAAPAIAEPAITWRVENPFRLFTDPADTEVHRATWEALSAEEKATPVLSAERALSQRHPDGWSATMFRKLCWSQHTNRYTCPDGSSYINPVRHNVVMSLEGIEEAVTLDCRWSTVPHGGKDRRGAIATQPCSEPFAAVVPYPGGLDVEVEIGGRVIAQSKVQVRDVLVVGIGDSFASGEGNPDIPVRFSRERSADYDSKGLTGYPARIGEWKAIGDRNFIEENARWVDQACHRSLYSYQLRTALQLAVEDPHRAVTYVGEACSGAEVTAGLFLRYKGNEWVPNPPDLSQISSVARAQCGGREAPQHDLPEAYHMNGKVPELQGLLVLNKCEAEDARKIDLLLVSIGGNDIGFSRLVANAVLADKSLLRKLGGWFGEIQTAAAVSAPLSTLPDRYKSLNRAIHNILHVPWDESDRVLLTAYPGLALLGDGSAICPDGNGGMEVFNDFRLSQKKALEGTRAADRLQRIMEESARAYGWTLVEKHRRAFIGRGICAGFLDNAFSIADDLRLPRKTADGAWYPYNPADYQAYVSRQRWFRTPNDAFMTGNFHVPASLLQKALKLETFSWFQLLLASTYSGAFHPTAEGHAAIADATVEAARKVLARHGEGAVAADR